MKMIRFIVVYILFSQFLAAQEKYLYQIREGNEPVAAGKFAPTWESLQQVIIKPKIIPNDIAMVFKIK